MASYFVISGVTPKAIANSIAWYIRSKSQPSIDEIFFITSSKDGRTSEGYSNEIVLSAVDILTDSLRILSPDSIDEIKINQNDPIFIPEANIPLSIKRIVKGIIERTSRGSEVVIDTTTGRKSMSGAAIVAGMNLHHKHMRKVWISYYWLHDYSPESLSKKIWELSLDEAETVVVGVDKIDDELAEINENH